MAEIKHPVRKEHTIQTAMRVQSQCLLSSSFWKVDSASVFSNRSWHCASKTQAACDKLPACDVATIAASRLKLLCSNSPKSCAKQTKIPRPICQSNADEVEARTGDDHSVPLCAWRILFICCCVQGCCALMRARRWLISHADQEPDRAKAYGSKCICPRGNRSISFANQSPRKFGNMRLSSNIASAGNGMSTTKPQSLVVAEVHVCSNA